MTIKRTDIINLLFSKYGFETYLEIGVRNPATNFNKINASLKHSVDSSSRGKYTYNTTSDDFFKNHVGNQKYDVIFIDALHLEEQAYKDVQNAIKRLNKDGFIIMHDCNPMKEYDTRSYEEYLKTGGVWNGTVFKAYIRLKCELKNWSCFVVNEDYGCGILTQRKLLENKLFKNDINNFSWENFNKNRKILLQLITFEEYCKLLV